MNVVSTQYTLKHESFEIFLSGCDGICGKSCHNYELRDFNMGIDHKLQIPIIINKIKDFDLLIKRVWILGGEPLLQDHKDLISLISQIKEKTNKEIWLWTRFEIDEIPWEIKEMCDYIKTGMYIEELKCNDNIQHGVRLATSNQQIHKLK